jgi:hypothetical protein
VTSEKERNPRGAEPQGSDPDTEHRRVLTDDEVLQLGYSHRGLHERQEVPNPDRRAEVRSLLIDAMCDVARDDALVKAVLEADRLARLITR